MTVAATPEEEPNNKDHAKGAPNYVFQPPGINLTVGGVGPGLSSVFEQMGLSGVSGGTGVIGIGVGGGFIDWPQQPLFPSPTTAPFQPGIVFPPSTPCHPNGPFSPPLGPIMPNIPNQVGPEDDRPSFFDDFIEVMTRVKKLKEQEERYDKMEKEVKDYAKACGVYKITQEEADDAVYADRVPFREAVVNMVIAVYAAVASVMVWPAKATMFVLKLPVKAAQLTIRAIKHTTLVMLPPSLLAICVIATIMGPRWIKWCCDVGGWPYHPPGEGDWAGFFICSSVAILVTLICTIAHFVGRIANGEWWWPQPVKKG